MNFKMIYCKIGLQKKVKKLRYRQKINFRRFQTKNKVNLTFVLMIKTLWSKINHRETEKLKNLTSWKWKMQIKTFLINKQKEAMKTNLQYKSLNQSKTHILSILIHPNHLKTRDNIKLRKVRLIRVKIWKVMKPTLIIIRVKMMITSFSKKGKAYLIKVKNMDLIIKTRNKIMVKCQSLLKNH